MSDQFAEFIYLNRAAVLKEEITRMRETEIFWKEVEEKTNAEPITLVGSFLAKKPPFPSRVDGTYTPDHIAAWDRYVIAKNRRESFEMWAMRRKIYRFPRRSRLGYVEKAEPSLLARICGWLRGEP